MHFPFYPRHEYGCPHVDHCPHLGSASLGSLVHCANAQQDQTAFFWRQIDGLRREHGQVWQDRGIDRESRTVGAGTQGRTSETIQTQERRTGRRSLAGRGASPRPKETRSAPKVIRAGIASGLSSSIGWFSFLRRASAHAAVPRSRPDPTAHRTITFRKIGSTASGW